MKVFLKNYNIGKLLPPEIEKIPVRKPGGEVPAGRRECRAGKPDAKNRQICTKKDHPVQSHRPHQSSPIFMFSRFFQNPVFRNSYRIS
ncbi:MAG: hypothetical protein ACLVFN_04655 [Enterocloster sp.]|jgi:hypothetical protein